MLGARKMPEMPFSKEKPKQEQMKECATLKKTKENDVGTKNKGLRGNARACERETFWM